MVIEQRTGASSLAIDTDDLIGTEGAGVYTITLSDRSGNGSDEIKVRLPMQFVAESFESTNIPDQGSYTDNHGTETFRVLGGPGEQVYYFEVLDMNDRPVTAEIAAFWPGIFPQMKTNSPLPTAYHGRSLSEFG